MLAVFGPRAGCRLACVLAVLGFVAAAPGTHAETVTVEIDQASLLKLPEKVSTIVIGNPLVADASLQRGNLLIVTGKSYGQTNLLALDRSGNVMMDRTIQVRAGAGNDLVTVYRGTERESYSCAPKCERRIMLGDAPPYFAATIGEAGARTSAAAPAAR